MTMAALGELCSSLGVHFISAKGQHLNKVFNCQKSNTKNVLWTPDLKLSSYRGMAYHWYSAQLLSRTGIIVNTMRQAYTLEL